VVGPVGSLGRAASAQPADARAGENRTRLACRAGTARILDDDDPFPRLATLCAALRPMRRLAAAILRFSVRLLDTEPVTVRIDLDPAGR